MDKCIKLSMNDATIYEVDAIIWLPQVGIPACWVLKMQAVCSTLSFGVTDVMVARYLNFDYTGFMENKYKITIRKN